MEKYGCEYCNAEICVKGLSKHLRTRRHKRNVENERSPPKLNLIAARIDEELTLHAMEIEPECPEEYEFICRHCKTPVPVINIVQHWKTTCPRGGEIRQKWITRAQHLLKFKSTPP